MARKPTDDDEELDMPLLLAEHRLDGIYEDVYITSSSQLDPITAF